MARRLRRAGKWAGLALTVALSIAWLASLRWFAVYISGQNLVGVGDGVVLWGWDIFAPPANGTLWDAGLVDRWPGWWNTIRSLGGVVVPLWALALAAALPTTWLWRRDRRGNSRNLPGHCRCGYDLAGLPPGGPCPECGRV